jgi:hypothetical protein
VAQDIADNEIDEELLEFLQADLLPEAADARFKQRLRDYLRAMLRASGTLPMHGRGDPSDDDR